ncbi:hypothetical protein VTN77DRAFT_2396 [Rasamsonia byssochlamydoides]|uniref:uncharacterized protein n=1 Tax=Rasamsonia byssochlamydoides TaxID=89139 RepID=UPI00374429FE
MASPREEEGEDEVPDGMVSSFFSSQSDLSTIPAVVDARAAEDRVARYRLKNNDDRTKQVLSSFLQFLQAEGRQVLADFIANTVDDRVLFSLYKHLLTSILVPMKARSATPTVTPSPFDDNDDAVKQIAASMDESPSRKSQAQLEKLCLHRDNFRCMVTGIVDVDSKGMRASLAGISGPTQLSHILPLSIGRWDNNKQDHAVSQVWATLTKCFPRIELGPSDINHPTNLMTLYDTVHSAFGKFTLAFEPTSSSPFDESNEYKVLTFGRKYPTVLDIHLPQPNAHGDRIVKFEKYADVDLPSPVLLQIHAALANILHASGTAEYIDKVMEEREEIQCLASNGSTNIQRLLFAF